MRRRRTLLALAAGVLVIAVVVVVVLIANRQRAGVARAGPAQPPSPEVVAPPSSFEVRGQRFTCGTSGQVRLEAGVSYPDPDAFITVDGQRQPATGDDVGLTMSSAPTYMCADGMTHHVHIKSGQREPFNPGCGVSLVPAVKHVAPPYYYNDAPRYDESTCDLTWTD